MGINWELDISLRVHGRGKIGADGMVSGTTISQFKHENRPLLVLIINLLLILGTVVCYRPAS